MSDDKLGPQAPPRVRVRLDHPIKFLTGDREEKAVEHLRTYFHSYTGSWFERLADPDPYRITANDVTAVSTLGVEIPANTAIWLLDGGAAVTSRWLRDVPPNQAIWDPAADLTSDGPMWRLWDHLQAGGWPQHVGGMGPTKTSKLLAVKRSHLVPIHDSLVEGALFAKAPTNYWAPWLEWFIGESGATLRLAAEGVRDQAGVGAHLSVLRIIDIVIWMAQKRG